MYLFLLKFIKCSDSIINPFKFNHEGQVQMDKETLCEELDVSDKISNSLYACLNAKKTFKIKNLEDDKNIQENCFRNFNETNESITVSRPQDSLNLVSFRHLDNESRSFSDLRRSKYRKPPVYPRSNNVLSSELENLSHLTSSIRLKKYQSFNGNDKKRKKKFSRKLYSHEKEDLDGDVCCDYQSKRHLKSGIFKCSNTESCDCVRDDQNSIHVQKAFDCMIREKPILNMLNSESKDKKIQKPVIVLRKKQATTIPRIIENLSIEKNCENYFIPIECNKKNDDENNEKQKKSSLTYSSVLSNSTEEKSKFQKLKITENACCNEILAIQNYNRQLFSLYLASKANETNNRFLQRKKDNNNKMNKNDIYNEPYDVKRTINHDSNDHESIKPEQREDVVLNTTKSVFHPEVEPYEVLKINQIDKMMLKCKNSASNVEDFEMEHYVNMNSSFVSDKTSDAINNPSTRFNNDIENIYESSNKQDKFVEIDLKSQTSKNKKTDDISCKRDKSKSNGLFCNIIRSVCCIKQTDNDDNDKISSELSSEEGFIFLPKHDKNRNASDFEKELNTKVDKIKKNERPSSLFISKNLVFTSEEIRITNPNDPNCLNENDIRKLPRTKENIENNREKVSSHNVQADLKPAQDLTTQKPYTGTIKKDFSKIHRKTHSVYNTNSSEQSKFSTFLREENHYEYFKQNNLSSRDNMFYNPSFFV